MRHDTYLVMTCKHTPCKRIDIGSGKHRIQQWRCACGKNVALTELQVMYVALLQTRLQENSRPSHPLLVYYTTADIVQLNECRARMSKHEIGALVSIERAVVDSFRMPEAS